MTVLLKLYPDTDPKLGTDILNYAAKEGLGVELQLNSFSFKKSPESVFDWAKEHPSYAMLDKVYHASHVDSQGINIFQTDTRNSLISDIASAKVLGADKLVLHFHHELSHSERDGLIYRDQVEELSAIAVQHEVTLFLENTLFEFKDQTAPYADHAFYLDLFEVVILKSLKGIGFCFDIGHAKAFSKSPFKEWSNLLNTLRDYEIPLHFHLHNNDGVKDMHMSVHLAETEGLNYPCYFSGKHSHVDIICDIIKTYPGTKTLEVPAAVAIPGHQWLKLKGYFQNKTQPAQFH